MKHHDLRCHPTPRPTRVASPVRVGLLVLGLLCTLLLAATPAQASHFRYGSLTWQTAASDPTGKTIVFKVTQAFRDNYFFPIPVVGDIEYTSNLDFGDGNFAPINLVVTSVDAPGSSFFGEVTIAHTYANSGPYTAFYDNCCRLSSLQNNADGTWHVATDVTAGSFNSSPVSTLPAVVNLAVGQLAATFTVPGSDSSPLTFAVLAGNPSFTQAPGLMIGATTGIATFPTTGKTIGDLYNGVVTISDGSTTVMVDFLIRIVGSSQTPVFDYGPTPANGSTLTVLAGNPMSFTVQAHDPDAGDVLSLQGVGLPGGATFSPPALANPVSSVFSWTPTAADAGPHVVTFTAQDQVGVQALSSVTINVILCNPNATASIAAAATSAVFTGGPVTTIYLGYGPQTVSLTASGPYANYAWSPSASLSAATGATVIASPTTTTTYTVTNSNAAGCTATGTITIKVVDARCGNKNDKVLVCHNGHEICISPNAVNTHLTSPSHTDVLGPCPAAARASLNAPLSESVSLEAYPNPAAEQATILFRSMHAANASVAVYNSLGVRVATLYDGTAEAGEQVSVVLDTKSLANGLYHCRVVANGQTKTMSLMVVK